MIAAQPYVAAALYAQSGGRPADSVRCPNTTTRSHLRNARTWHFLLGLVLIFWGAMLLDWITFTRAADVLGIGAIVTGILALIDK